MAPKTEAEGPKQLAGRRPPKNLNRKQQAGSRRRLRFLLNRLSFEDPACRSGLEQMLVALCTELGANTIRDALSDLWFDLLEDAAEIERLERACELAQQIMSESHVFAA
jgi:hypothetical protein